jgi:hypothetical protein
LLVLGFLLFITSAVDFILLKVVFNFAFLLELFAAIQSSKTSIDRGSQLFIISATSGFHPFKVVSFFKLKFCVVLSVSAIRFLIVLPLLGFFTVSKAQLHSLSAATII